MSDIEQDWKPGSFTKNFSWGPAANGLARLHETIRLGFSEEMMDVPRQVFRDRVSTLNRPDFIPMNFFLFNKQIDGVDYIVADELVFQAINFGHSRRFDKLALFAFNFSYVGRFKNARADQRRPALWAFHYIKNRVNDQFNWDTSKVNADDIDYFLSESTNYKGQPSRRKAATNLAHLYLLGRLSELENSRVDRWWVDALFLALDRLIDDRLIDKLQTLPSQLASLLRGSGFNELTGRSSLERRIATDHLIRLYTACGGRQRFSDSHVRQLTKEMLAEFVAPNDQRPRGAIHRTNARILKSIPRICAMLAKEVGFDIIDSGYLKDFDLEQFVADRTREALQNLKDKQLEPTMTAQQLLKLTRGK